jgi:CheY-like chemotaxis protein
VNFGFVITTSSLVEEAAERTRVLVADDDVDVCSLISGVFRRKCVVTVAHDAEHALSIMSREEPFDVIISDYMLPGVSGLDFILRVRSEPMWSQTPIIMITGHGASLKARAIDAGANGFLSKPFTLEQLRNVVTKALQYGKKSL